MTPAETVAALFKERLADSADVAAIVDDVESLTYAELERRSADIASALLARGLEKGDAVGLLMPNSANWAATAYALMRVGAIVAPLSTLLRPRELQQQLATAGIKRLILSESHRGRNYRDDIAQLDRSALPALADIVWWSEFDFSGPSDRTAVAVAEAAVTPSDDMAIMFTSGSQGAPKGIIHTHGGAIRATRDAAATRCFRKGERVYLPMPFFWMGGFGAGLLAALISGATLITEHSPEPARTLRLLERERVTIFRGWPDQALQIARHPDFAAADLSSLRPGSLEALLPPELRSAPGRRANLYGMTESFGPIAGWPLDQDMPESGWGSFGKPLGSIRMRIVDPDTLEELSPNQVGLLQISGPNIMRGMCGRDHAEVFTPDNWYNTGDLAQINDEGFLFFVGRRDDMFKVKGATVYPSEVEEALTTIPGVLRAFATNIEIDGQNAVGAAVLLGEGVNIDIGALAEAARQRLSAFKLPARWTILGSLRDLPMLGSGKLDKAAFRALVAAGQAPPARRA